MSEVSGALRSNDFILLQERTEEFKKYTGRRPRILLTDMGKNAEECSVRVLALAYADVGFDVDISTVGMTDDIIARMAVENDVHVVSVCGADNEMRVPNIVKALEDLGSDDIKVIAGKDRLVQRKVKTDLDLEGLIVHHAKKTISIIGA